MDERKTILLVEDNRQLNEINRRALERAGHRVVAALSLGEARAQLDAHSPDAIILDIMLPDGDGVAFCREIRPRTAAPILFLTSVAGYQQTLEGLAAGGDDYLTKPFDLDLLLAKVAAFLRRDDIAGRMRGHLESLDIGPLRLDAGNRAAYLYSVDMQLAPKEFSVLLLLARAQGQALPAEQIYSQVWRQPMADDPNALRVVISRLRRKLSPAGLRILVSRGAGYQLVHGPCAGDAPAAQAPAGHI